VLLLLLLDCCCLRGKSLSSRILEDRFTSHCPCPWTTKSSKIVKDSALCKQSVMCDYVKFISSVTATMHEDMMKNVLLTDVRYYLLMSVSKPFFAVSHSSCKVAKLAYLSNGLHLVLKCNFFTYLWISVAVLHWPRRQWEASPAGMCRPAPSRIHWTLCSFFIVS